MNDLLIFTGIGISANGHTWQVEWRLSVEINCKIINFDCYWKNASTVGVTLQLHLPLPLPLPSGRTACCPALRP